MTRDTVQALLDRVRFLDWQGKLQFDEGGVDAPSP
jgi:hypothetical protein